MDKARKLDALLDGVDYRYLNSAAYVPTDFALGFAAFIKLVNGADDPEAQTPALHLAMLDKIDTDCQYVANLCFRGAAKTTVLAEYLVLYLGVFGALPTFGQVLGIIYVSDSMDNGAKSAQRNMHWRWLRVFIFLFDL